MLTVITGGAGFIGLALARRLVGLSTADDQIIIVDTIGRHGMHPDLERVLAHPRVKFVQTDLTLPSSLDPISIPVDRVYHLAGRVGVGPVTAAPMDVLRTNTLSAMHVFEWFVRHASPGARLLFASTSEVYGGATLSGFELPVPTPETAPAVISDLGNPRFSYALTKMWGEAYATHLSRETGTLLASVRYHNVYGPRMGNDHVIPQITARIKRQEDPFQIIGADQTRSFCWIGDAVESTHLVLESRGLTPGAVIHVGNQKGEIEIGRLYETIFELCRWRPRTVLNLSAPPGSVARRCPDVTRLRALTDYEPSTPLREGLEKTVRWYLEQSK